MAIYIWTGIWPVSTPWIYHNASAGLITLSTDWTYWYTIADKNLWANTVYEYWDTLNASNCWDIFQWWNNYGFSRDWGYTISTSIVDVSSYWPWEYSNAVYVSVGDGNLWSTRNDDLWWDLTDTDEARQWPCNSGWHIPTRSQWVNIVSAMNSLGLSTGANYQTYLKIPFAWYRRANDPDTQKWVWEYTYLWTSSVEKEALCWSFAINSSGPNTGDHSNRASTLSIRPFKNVWVAPDNSRTVLYQPS